MGRSIVVETDDLSILNQCAKYLARAGDPATDCAEAWRFPLLGPDRSLPADAVDDTHNEVTFVYRLPPDATPPREVGVVGTFADLYQALPLPPVFFLGDPTGYYAVTCRVPQAQVHTYQLVVDGRLTPDPINPQRVVLDNGKTWSRFSPTATCSRWCWNPGKYGCSTGSRSTSCLFASPTPKTF